MNKISQEELDKKVNLHRIWLEDKEGGERLVLTESDLSGVILTGANLGYAILTGANLRHTNLSEANLTGANLRHANLRYADLRYSDLSSADLRNANLRYADLSFIDLNGTNLTEANLSFTDLGGTNLTEANLNGANTNSSFGAEIYSVDNIGTYKGKATYLPELDIVFAGCWKGTLDGFLEKGLEMNKEDEKEIGKIKATYDFFKACGNKSVI